MERIALVSDIHGNLLALEAVVEDIKRRNVSRVINLGDHVSGPLWPKETLKYLKSTDWIHICGNHDRQLTSDDPDTHGLSDAYAFAQIDREGLRWLESLPAFKRLEADILAFHGSPQNDLEYMLESVSDGRTHLSKKGEIEARLKGTKARLAVCGHTHIPRCVRLNNEMTIVNPGSVGIQGFTDNGDHPHVVEIGSPHARYAVVELDGSALEVELIAVSYDWDKAADKSMETNRADWTSLLRNGFIE